MLDLACPVCNNPIFQVQGGDKACVVCERKVILESELPESTSTGGEPPLPGSRGNAGPPHDAISLKDSHGRETRDTIFHELRDVALHKLAMLVDELDHARTVQEVSMVNKAITEILSILERLKFA